MTDGLNGLLIALCLFWTACLLIYAPHHLTHYLLLLLFGLIVLLSFNIYGRLFLGDAGSYSLGIIVGLLMIYVYRESPHRLPMGTVVLWLTIPVIDCLRVMVERLLVGRSPFAADRNHLHHVLLRRFSERGALLAYLAIATWPGMVAAVWPSTTGPMAMTAVLAWLVTLLWLRAFDPDGSKARLRGALAVVTGFGRWASSTRSRL